MDYQDLRHTGLSSIENNGVVGELIAIKSQTISGLLIIVLVSPRSDRLPWAVENSRKTSYVWGVRVQVFLQQTTKKISYQSILLYSRIKIPGMPGYLAYTTML